MDIKFIVLVLFILLSSGIGIYLGFYRHKRLELDEYNKQASKKRIKITIFEYIIRLLLALAAGLIINLSYPGIDSVLLKDVVGLWFIYSFFRHAAYSQIRRILGSELDLSRFRKLHYFAHSMHPQSSRLEFKASDDKIYTVVDWAAFMHLLYAIASSVILFS